jgi:hypothetical protein
VHIAVGIPLFIISPGKIDFFDKTLFLFFLCEAIMGKKKGNEYDGGHAVAKPDF